jgi:hypothetical protein
MQSSQMAVSDKEFEQYVALLAELEQCYDGSKVAVTKALGVSRGGLHYRLKYPSSIRREHIYAAEGLLARLKK